MNIGFCGLGRMGQPMVRRLLEAGHQVRIWNRSKEKASALIQAGAVWCDTPAHMAEQCGVCVLVRL